jgi:hypothetical protein
MLAGRPFFDRLDMIEMGGRATARLATPVAGDLQNK